MEILKTYCKSPLKIIRKDESFFIKQVDIGLNKIYLKPKHYKKSVIYKVSYSLKYFYGLLSHGVRVIFF